MKTIFVRYLDVLNKVSIEHYDNEHMKYFLEISPEELNLDEASTLLQDLFSSDIDRLLSEYLEALNTLKLIKANVYSKGDT